MRFAMVLAAVLALGALAPDASLAGSQATGEESAPHEAEPDDRSGAYSEVRITPSIVPGLHTYFGQRDNIVGKQRHRLLRYHYPELLQPAN